MRNEILFRNKRLRSLALEIAAEVKFETILAMLNEVQFSNLPVKGEHVHYAILELINNSLRAQREKNRKDKIHLEYQCRDGSFYFSVQDAGGGFDPHNLPYDLAKPIDTIDTNGPAFVEYRERHEYQRFGLGLYAVKKLFNHMTITFLDSEKRPMHWQPGQVYGTQIEGLLEVKDGS